jgi:hypothetical protein
MRELVLVHGRAQEEKDSIELKKEWLDALRKGLEKSGLTLPIPEDRVRFPYYGDTLYGLVAGVAENEIAEVVVRGRGGSDAEEQQFILAVLDEVREQSGVSDAQVQAEAQAAVATRGGAAVVERGPLNWGWVQGILSAIDRHVPGASGGGIALATRDVYRYLRDPGIRDTIDSGVRKAMSPGVESVVVGHSLGSVVSYSLLKREGEAMGWKVPLYVTVGSPLAVKRIRKGFAPNKHPECVGKWFNAMDPRDVVALFALDDANFPIDPSIENKIDVDNDTSNRHGISGYLSDAVVARRIHEALVAG